MLNLLEWLCSSSYALVVLFAVGLSSLGLNLKRRRPKETRVLTSWPLLGSAVQHFVHFHHFHHWQFGLFQKSLTIATPMPLGQTFYYTIDPVNVKHILKDNFANYPKGEVFQGRMQDLLGDGIFNSDGDHWRAQRKTAATEFSLKSLRDYSMGSFKEHALRLVGLVSESCFGRREFDLQDFYMRMTLDSIGKIGFGVRVGSLPDRLPLPTNEFAAAFDRANEIVCHRFVDPLWKARKLLRIGSEAHMAACMRTINQFVYDVIAKRKLEREQLNEVDRADILSRFLKLNEVSDKTLRDVVLNFVIAGRDTTAVTLSWMTYQLAENEPICARLYEELRAFHERKRSEKGFESQPDGEPLQAKFEQFTHHLTFDSLKELHYLHAVVTETIRLYPAVPLDAKGILEDDVLPSGTHLKKGNLISYSPWCMGRMKAFWGPDAHVFNPDRWLQNGVFVPESEYKFTAFQAGPRMCLGKESAYLQLKVVAALVFRFFQFRRTESHEIMYRIMTTLTMQGGLNVKSLLRPEWVSFLPKT